MVLVHLTVNQLLVMAIYMLLGYLLRRLNVLSKAGSRDFAGLLVKVIIPAVIVNSFCEEFSSRRLVQLGESTLLALGLLLLSMLVAQILYPGKALENFSAAFSNAGFMGIPLVRAVLGEEALLFVVPFVALLNLLQWTYGVDKICERKQKKSFAALFRELLWNPPMIAICAGLLLFLCRWGNMLPAAVSTTIRGVCALNMPLAMMVLGIYLAEEDLLSVFSQPVIYGVSLTRLILIPLLSLALLSVLPFPQEIRQAILLCAAAPVGANVAVYAQLYGKDAAYASKMVVLSTMMSLITLPLITALSQLMR